MFTFRAGLLLCDLGGPALGCELLILLTDAAMVRLSLHSRSLLGWSGEPALCSLLGISAPWHGQGFLLGAEVQLPVRRTWPSRRILPGL